MANSRSTALKDFCARGGTLAQALNNGVLELYDGLRPTNADAAVTSAGPNNLLATVTLGGAAFTAEVVPQGKIVLAGASGSVNTLTVGGRNLIPFGKVNFNSTLTQTALDLITAINAASGIHGYTAKDGGAATVIISAVPGTGPYLTRGTNAWLGNFAGTFATLPIVAGLTTLTLSTNTPLGTSALVTSIAPCNGIPWGSDAGGGVFSPGVPIGTVNLQCSSCSNSGTITWGRFKGSVADAGGTDTNLIYMRWDMDAAADGTMELNTGATPATVAGSPWILNANQTTATEA